MKVKNKLMSGGIWAFIGKFSTSVMTLVVNVVLARFLQPSDLGVYFLAFNLALLGAYLGTLGFEQTILKYVADNMGKKMRANVVYVIKFSYISAIVGAIILGGLYYFSSTWISKTVFQSVGLYSISILLIFWIVANIFQILLGETFRGFQDIRFASIFGGVLSTTIFIVSFYFGYYFEWLEINLKTVIAVWVCSLVISNLLGIFFLIKKIYSIKQGEGPLEKKSLKSKELWSTAYPLLIVSVSSYILNQSDLWIIGMVRGDDDVAIYGATAKLTMIVSMPIFIVNAVVPPMIAEKFAQGKLKELEKMLRFVCTLATIPALGLVLLFAFYGGNVLSLLFGSFYSGGALMLFLLSIKHLFYVWFGVSGIVLAMTGKQKDLMRITLTTGMLSVILSFVLGSHFGGIGVAIGFLISSACSQIFSWIRVRNLLNVRADADFIGTFIQLKVFLKKRKIKKNIAS
ncbi:flippase [Peribacillus asahii]|uniref:flippase n=1 Tax=Peribacillus asahii TaxID=228899 RepID=UPI00207937EE|nr:flippase [Peribacillus asahii]USK68322.1 flippase [Peribacillus asahii]